MCYVIAHCTGQAGDQHFSAPGAAGQTPRNQPPGISVPDSILTEGEYM